MRALANNGTDFGSIPADATRTRTFTLTNSGNSELDLTDTPRVLIQSTTNANDSEHFVLTNPPVTPLAPGESTTFDISFTPDSTTTNARAVVQIRSNEFNVENGAFVIATFDLNGASHPDQRLAVFFDETPNDSLDDSFVPVPFEQAIADVDNGTQFGATAVAEGIIGRTFVVRNISTTENVELTGTPLVEVIGEHANDFTVVTQPSDAEDQILEPGDERNFTINFSPQSNGPREAVVSIASNDTLINSIYLCDWWNWHCPVIQVTGNDQLIVHNDEIPVPQMGLLSVERTSWTHSSSQLLRSLILETPPWTSMVIGELTSQGSMLSTLAYQMVKLGSLMRLLANALLLSQMWHSSTQVRVLTLELFLTQVKKVRLRQLPLFKQMTR